MISREAIVLRSSSIRSTTVSQNEARDLLKVFASFYSKYFLTFSSYKRLRPLDPISFELIAISSRIKLFNCIIDVRDYIQTTTDLLQP